MQRNKFIRIVAMNYTVHRFKQAVVVFLLLLMGCRAHIDARVKKNRDAYELSERVVRGVLKNGITYYYLNNATPKGRCYLRLNVGVGSFSEADDEGGMAHLVEHLAFDDRALSKDQHLAEWLQKQGLAFGPDANASTSTENTVYKLDLPSCDEQSIRDGLLVLKSFASDLVFREEAIAKEKNIIDAEESAFNTKEGQLSLKIIENLYSGSSHALKPVLGTKAVRAAFTKEQITAFYNAWYHPKNLSIMLVGDYDGLNPAALMQSIFHEVTPRSAWSKPQKIHHPDHKKPFFIIHDPAASSVQVSFTIQAKKLSQQTYKTAIFKDRMAFNLALFMVKNLLSAQAKNTADSLGEPSIDGYLVDKGIYELSLNVSAKKENIEDAFMEAYKTLLRASKHGFSPAEFEPAHKALIDSVNQEVVREVTLGSDTWIERLVSYHQGKAPAFDVAYFQEVTRPILQSITAKDCQRVLKQALASGHHYFFATGALEETPDNLSMIKDLLRRAQLQKIAPVYTEETPDFAYHVPDEPNPALLFARSLDYIFAHQLIFHNNVNLLFKPTSFKSDEIVMNVVVGDGYGIMDKKDYALAVMAHMVLLDGGLNKHPPHEIPNLLRDKQLGVSLQILERRLQVSVSTRKKDFRFALELLRAFLIDPMYDEKSFTRAQEKIKAFYQERAHTIDAPLQHEFLKLLTNNDHRVGLPELSELLSITRNQFISWHQKYLQQQPLKIVVVGDITKEQVTRDVGSVLGTLPMRAINKKPEAKKLSFASGVHKVYNVVSQDKASRVMISYPLSFPAVYPDLRLSLMRDIIHEQVRLKLREKRQVLYAARVSVVDSPESFLQSRLDIYTAVDKALAPETKTRLVRALDKLAHKGISEQALTKAREPLIATIAQAMKSNSYWADMLMNSIDSVDLMKWVDTVDRDIKKITVKDINAMLRKYFNTKNASSAIVNPGDGT